MADERRLDLRAGDDAVPGGAGDDAVPGGAGDDAVPGGAGDDAVPGGAGDDAVPGGAGDDVAVRVPGVDREAEFAAFVVTAAPALGRTAWLLCGDVPRAEELVQHALVRTYLAWGTAREGEPLAYARRVLANLRIDTWRKQRREVLTAPGDLPERPTDHDADRHATHDHLTRALLELPPRRRRVVVLRHVVGLSEREVADDLGISVGAVKSAGSRGLAQLRGLLAADDGPHAGRDARSRKATRR